MDKHANVKQGDIPLQSPEDDDARQGLIKPESRTPVKAPSEQIEVKFIANDSSNGDAKINIEQIKSAFAGMSKDELLKYVNDPFWVRVRMILFISFWLIWIVMFAAAIAIIIVAPRCQAPTPKKWYQEGPIYDANIDSFSPNGKFSGIKDNLGYLEELNVKGLIISSPFLTDETGNIKDFYTIDPKYGNLIDFKNFITAAKDKGIRILLSFVPNYSHIQHDWFNKSEANEEPFASYYVWASQKGTTDGNPLPPNNWKSKTGGPAWTWNEKRSQFYLHQFNSNQPDLNFLNSKVRDEFTAILTYWLSLGVSGFNIEKAQYLVEDPEFQDEEIGVDPGSTHEQYEFYMHGRTYNRPELVGILQQWRGLIHNKTEGDGLLIITGEPPIPSDTQGASVAIVDLSRHTFLAEGLELTFPADDPYPESFAKSLAKRVEAFVGSNDSWTAVQTATGKLPMGDNFAKEAVDALNMLVHLLPGTPVTFSGDELGLTTPEGHKFPWGPVELNISVAHQKLNENSHFGVYKLMADIRNNQAVLYGNSTVKVQNDTLVFIRWKTGHPGYVFVYNTVPSNVTVDLTQFSQLPMELTVHAVGSESFLSLSGRVQRDSIPLSPKSAAVFTFVPNSES